MKKKFLVSLCLLTFSFMLFSEDLEDIPPDYTTSVISEKKESPKEEKSEKEKNKEILQFGLDTEVLELLVKLIKEEDSSFANDVYSAFNETRTVTVKDKCIEYFAAIKDDRLSSFASDLLEDPYDEKKSTVKAVFNYVAKVKVKSCNEPIVELLKSENKDYIEECFSTLGKIGGSDEAVFLAEYLENDLSIAEKQALVRALGELKAVETWDKLVEIAENSDENTFVRMHAAEALGAMEKDDSIDVLINLYKETDPNLRKSVIIGLSHFDNPKAKNVIVSAIKDDFYKTRLEAINAVKELNMKEAIPNLLYRAKNDPETVVKYKCFETLASLNSKDCIDYLLSVVKDKKGNDAHRGKAAYYLLQNNFDAGIADIADVVIETLKDNNSKNLRYAIGKELAKYESGKIEKVCAAFLADKDPQTQGIGLDMYDKNRFSSIKPTVEAIAENSKSGSLQKKAKRILNK